MNLKMEKNNPAIPKINWVPDDKLFSIFILARLSFFLYPTGKDFSLAYMISGPPPYGHLS
jgi:hypothetical protein